MVHLSPDVARFIVFVAVLGRNRNMETAPAATTICPASVPPSCAPRTRNIIPPCGRIVYPQTRPKRSLEPNNNPSPPHPPPPLSPPQTLPLAHTQPRPLPPH